MNTYETFWQAIAAELDLRDDQAQAMAIRLIAKGIASWEQWLAVGGACRMNPYLQSIAANDPDFNRKMLADGILWADQSCRISGTLSLAIRNASNEQIDAILDRMIADGCSVMADAPCWLNAHYRDLTAW